MRVKEGDVLVCGTPDCKVELTVTRDCQSKDESCEIEISCCDEPMELKEKSL